MKGGEIKFTIFTGFYNYLDNLETLYQSIKNQTYPNWEWLVCDDFSQGSEVSERLKLLSSIDSRIRVIYPNWKNQYYWNLPISESKGEFIVVQDSDDKMHSKLLECYLYNFNKFPELAVIGSTSILRDDISIGSPMGAKFVRYNGASNYIEGLEKNVQSVSGDARAFRKSAILHKGEITRDGEYEYTMAEDILKMTNYEECGKFLCLPRTLHDYTFRVGSVSGPMWQLRGVPMNMIEKENSEILERAKSRKDRKKLDSILDYYDRSFNSMYQMYYSDLGNIKYRARVEYHNSNLSARDRNLISELYFDHDFIFNEKSPHPSHLIFSIRNESDIENFKNRLSVIDKSIVSIIVTAEEEAQDIKEKIESSIYEVGLNGWYFIGYGGVFTYCITPE